MPGANGFSLQTNSNNQVIVTLMDYAADPPVPSYLNSTQVFNVFPQLGTITNLGAGPPFLMTIAAGVPQGYAQVEMSLITYAPSGVVYVTVTPYSGPLNTDGVPAQQCLISIDPGELVDTMMSAPACTRPILRDEIRAMISVTPPIDTIPGALQGEEPIAQAWPSNVLLNRCISDAITKINRTCQFYNQVALTLPVTATTNQGVQWNPLQGLGGTANQNVINKILRVSWDDGTGNPILLRPQSWQADDNQQWYRFNQLSPSTPYWYIMNAYQLGLLPGASTNGTLDIWAGTGIINFASDTDVLNQLPIDYQPVIKYLAATFVLMSNPSLKDAKDQIAMYGKLAEDGLGEIKRWASTISELQQNGLTFRSKRTNYWV